MPSTQTSVSEVPDGATSTAKKSKSPGKIRLAWKSFVPCLLWDYFTLNLQLGFSQILLSIKGFIFNLLYKITKYTVRYSLVIVLSMNKWWSRCVGLFNPAVGLA